MDKVALLEEVAKRWNREAIPYAVAHGIEAYPGGIGRDLDVLAAPRHRRRLIDAAQDVLEAKGLLVVRPPRLWGERLVAAALDPEPDLLEVHALDSISWGVAQLATCPSPRTTVGPFAVDPWVRFAKRVLLPALAGDIEKLQAELERYPVQEPEAEAAKNGLPRLLGGTLARSFQRAVEDRDYLAMTRLIPLARRAVVREMWIHSPAAVAGRLGKALWRRARQPFATCSPIVSIVGPSHSGRTMLQRSICQGDRLVFTRCVAVRYATPRAPASGWTQHWIRLAQYLFRSAVRSLVTDRLHSSRQRLVVYDGCAIDLVLDPRRFGLRSAAGARLCWYLLPKPDLIVLLGTPDTAVSCRVEPSAEQESTQYASWRRLLARETSAMTLSGDRPIPELRMHVVRLVVRAFVTKNRRMPSPASRHAGRPQTAVDNDHTSAVSAESRVVCGGEHSQK